MSYYELGIASVAAATGAAYQTIHGATSSAVRIFECGHFCNAATASPYSIGRPANTPVASTSVLVKAVNPDADVTGVTNVDSAWSTAPTTPTTIFRLCSLPATIGAGMVFVWPEGSEIFLSKTAGANQWVTIWNYSGSTGSVLNSYWKVRE
jgi:hypothetical protein